jgi:hypothetical protein
MFFRVPPGRYTANLDTDIEIIQRHHRYAVVAPSIHHEIGAPYQWYDPAGHLSARMPAPGELAELPAVWVAYLAEGASAVTPAASSVEAGAILLGELGADTAPACRDLYVQLDAARRELSGALAGARHDVMTARVYNIVQLNWKRTGAR